MGIVILNLEEHYRGLSLQRRGGGGMKERKTDLLYRELELTHSTVMKWEVVPRD